MALDISHRKCKEEKENLFLRWIKWQNFKVDNIRLFKDRMI